MTDTAAIPGERICSFIERVERIDEEIKALNDGKKEVFSEAKGEGFDVKVLKEILRLRKQDKDERDEQSRCLTCISGPWRARAHRKPRQLRPNQRSLCAGRPRAQWLNHSYRPVHATRLNACDETLRQ